MLRSACLVWLLCLLGCSPAPPEAVRLVLVPPEAPAGDGEAELATEGLSALLLARLRALPELTVRVDPQGCEWSEATHSLSYTREQTATSAITAVALRYCASDAVLEEQWVQPRHERRDWSAQAAWWVGGKLQVPRPPPHSGAVVAEAQMQGFLVALARIKRRTAADVAAARQALREIVAQRPDFALAQAHLATAELLAFEYGLEGLPQALQRADAAIEGALRVDPDLGMAHAARGLYWMNQEDYESAANALARAIALDPGEAAIALWLGNALLYRGLPLQARPWLEQARRLDAELVSAQISLGETACLAAIEDECQAFLSSANTGPMASFMVALLSAHRGQLDQAQRLLDNVAGDVNRDWVQSLRVDLCALDPAASPHCAEDRIAAMSPGWAIAPGAHLRPDAPLPDAPLPNAPVLDLWRLDLGLAQWVRQARHEPTVRSQLLEELARLQQGGLRLPLLDQIERCLVPASELAAPEPTPLQPMLAAWGC